jgi:hypothetical protein
MRLYEITDQESPKYLKDVARIATNMHDADFWITRRGLQSKVGTPTREFHRESFGIKVTRKDLIDPTYLYYAVSHLHNQGYFSARAIGVTALTNIRLRDIEHIPLTFR